MRDSLPPLIAAAAIILTTSIQAIAADADPQNFLAHLYAHYPVAGKAHPSDPISARLRRCSTPPLCRLSGETSTMHVTKSAHSMAIRYAIARTTEA